MILFFHFSKFSYKLQIPRLLLCCSNIDYILSIHIFFRNHIFNYMSFIDMVFCISKVLGYILFINMVFSHMIFLNHISSFSMIFIMWFWSKFKNINRIFLSISSHSMRRSKNFIFFIFENCQKDNTSQSFLIFE